MAYGNAVKRLSGGERCVALLHYSEQFGDLEESVNVKATSKKTAAQLKAIVTGNEDGSFHSIFFALLC